MAYNNRLIWDPIRTVAFGAITGAFGAMGVAIASPVRIIALKNFTDQILEYSDDGVNAKVILLPSSAEVMDITANKVRDDGFFLGEGSIIYVRHVGIAPTTGNAHTEITRA